MASGWPGTGQNGLRMARDSPGWLRMARDGSGWPRMAPGRQRAQEPTTTQVTPNFPGAPQGWRSRDAQRPHTPVTPPGTKRSCSPLACPSRPRPNLSAALSEPIWALSGSQSVPGALPRPPTPGGEHQPSETATKWMTDGLKKTPKKSNYQRGRVWNTSFEIQICLAFLAAEIIFGAADESFECFLPSSPSPSHPFEGCRWHSQFPALLLSEFFTGGNGGTRARTAIFPAERPLRNVPPFFQCNRAGACLVLASLPSSLSPHLLLSLHPKNRS